MSSGGGSPPHKGDRQPHRTSHAAALKTALKKPRQGDFVLVASQITMRCTLFGIKTCKHYISLESVKSKLSFDIKIKDQHDF